MAGSSVVYTRRKLGLAVEHKFVWVPDTTTSAVTAATTGNGTGEVVGKIMRFTTKPASGAAAPTDNYDVTIVDENGVDVLAGLGADRDTANTESKDDDDGLLFVFANSLDLTVSAAGTTGGGTVLLYVLDMSDDPI
jgi:hypothetical protein